MKSFTGADGVLAGAGSAEILDRAWEQRFDRIFAANGPALMRLAASYTNTLSDRDDLLQEMAIALWRALPRFRGECSERTFLFRVAHNRGIAYLARTRSTMPGFDDDIEARIPRPTPNRDWCKRRAPGG